MVCTRAKNGPLVTSKRNTEKVPKAAAVWFVVAACSREHFPGAWRWRYVAGLGDLAILDFRKK